MCCKSARKTYPPSKYLLMTLLKFKSHYHKIYCTLYLSRGVVIKCREFSLSRKEH